MTVITAVGGDEFAKEEMYIIYGSKGWTEVTQSQAETFVRAGIVRRVKSTGGTGWQTHIYCSTDGVLPDD